MFGILWRQAAILSAYLVFIAIVFAPILLGLTRLLGVKWTLHSSGVNIVIATVVIGPLLEELVFRAGLRNATMTLAVQPVLIPLLIGEWQVALALGGVVATVILVDQVRQRYLNDVDRFSVRMARGRAFLTRYRLIVWGYAVAFGLVHTANFSITTTNGWLSCFTVFVVSSQMITGIFLSYFRLRYGLLSAIAFHAMFNSSCFLFDKIYP